MIFRHHWRAPFFAGFLVAAGATLAADGQIERRLPTAADPAVPATLPQPLPSAYPRGALEVDCSHVADGLGGPGYQFIATCPGRAVAPNGQWAVEQVGREAGGVRLADADGRHLDEIPNLTDGMPFVLFWSPRSDWFFANHYQGSAKERLRVFQIVNRQAIERSAIFAEATRIAVERYPCLGRSATVYASGWRWSRDGRRIAMTVYSRPDACLVERGPDYWVPAGDWEVLWMIGDAESGRIDPASVRVRPSGIGPMPTDGPYATL